MPERNWNERYASGDAPWDTGSPDGHLVDLVRAGRIVAGKCLDIGCGTGTNSIWLAEQGFEVVGVDLAPLAIEDARAKAASKSLTRCRFETLDFLLADPAGGPFHFIFDRGCFHVFDDPDVRARFATRVASLLGRHGLWLSLIGSTEGPWRDTGPPRRSARDVTDAVEPALELVELRSIRLTPQAPDPAMGWLCLSRHRTQPAQPSTR